MTFTRRIKKITYPYSLDDVTLERPDVVSDLGVSFDSKLSFVHHIAKIIHSAYKCLGFIVRNTKDFTKVSSINIIYFAFVRSKLEYASVIWSPFYNIHSSNLERIQRRFLKFVTFMLDGSYPVRNFPQDLLLNRFGIQSLAKRRSLHLTVFLYKLIHNFIDCKYIVEQISYRIPRVNSRYTTVLYLPRAKTNMLASSPLYQMLRNYCDIEADLDIFCCSLQEIKFIFG